MNIGNYIRYYRERAGMLQTDLGRALGVSAQAVSKWELGKAEPDIECLKKMCDMFGVSADMLLGRETPGREEVKTVFEGLTPDQQEQAKQYIEFLRSLKKP